MQRQPEQALPWYEDVAPAHLASVLPMDLCGAFLMQLVEPERE